jgi:hypothetical protein
MKTSDGASRWALAGMASILVLVGGIALTPHLVAEVGDETEDTPSATSVPPRGCCECMDHAKGGYGGGGSGRGARRAHHYDNIHALLDQHEAIERWVEEIDGGVETVTTSDDHEVTERIREHVRQMRQRMEAGHGMRYWDPLFLELFRNHDKIRMEIEDVRGGVRVREISDDPQVVLLIRQHAIRGIDEFVAEGHARARRETPLPEGYRLWSEMTELGWGCR